MGRRSIDLKFLCTGSYYDIYKLWIIYQAQQPTYRRPKAGEIRCSNYTPFDVTLIMNQTPPDPLTPREASPVIFFKKHILRCLPFRDTRAL